MKPKYKALQKERADLLAEANRLLSAENPAAEDLVKADEITTTKIPAIDAQLATFERLFEAERTAPARSSITVTPRIEQDPMRGFADGADFARAVHAASAPGGNVDARLRGLGSVDPQAAPTGYGQEGHASEGYMVPPQMRQEIWGIAFDQNDILGMIQTEPTESNAVELLADESTPWGATGIQAKWAAEAAQMTPSRLQTDPRQVRLHKLYAFVTATDELLADAPRMAARITAGAGRAIQWKASEAILRGTGSGQPLGFLTSPAVVSVAKESGQGAATILPKNLTKMYTRMLDMPGANWVWLANRNIVSELVDLKIGNEPSWVAQNRGLVDAPSGTLLGIPIRFTAHCATLGTVQDICLIDLAGYYAAVKSGGVKFDSSIHLYFDYGLTAFRWTFRIGGQPYLSAAVSQAHGSSTQSCAITLDTRS